MSGLVEGSSPSGVTFFRSRVEQSRHYMSGLVGDSIPPWRTNLRKNYDLQAINLVINGVLLLYCNYIKYGWVSTTYADESQNSLSKYD